MNDFQEKNVGGPSLGDLLREQREKSGLSLGALAGRSRVQEKYIKALEAGDYLALPERIYQRNFIKALAEVFKLETGDLLEQHDLELGQVAGVYKLQPAPPRPHSRLSFLVAPRILFGTLLVLVPLLAAIALGYEAWRIVSPPDLEVSEPLDNHISTEPSIKVRGKTEKEAELRVNGEAVYLAADGSFAELIHLHRGVNLIKITAKKQHSNENVIYRRVLWGQPEVTETDEIITKDLNSGTSEGNLRGR